MTVAAIADATTTARLTQGAVEATGFTLAKKPILDPKLQRVLEEAGTPSHRVAPLIPILFENPARIAATLGGLFNTSSGEFFMLQVTGQVDGRVSQKHMENASHALEQTGFTDFDRSWGRADKSSFIIGAARVGEYLKAGQINKQEAAGYLDVLSFSISNGLLPRRP